MSVMVWTDSNDMKKGIVVTGDEGSPMGGCKVCKMSQKAKRWKNWQNGQKVMKK